MSSRQHLLLPRLYGFFMFLINVKYGFMNGEKKIMHRAAGATRRKRARTISTIWPNANGRDVFVWMSEMRRAAEDALRVSKPQVDSFTADTDHADTDHEQYLLT
jgi:hypothetical protein